MKKFKKIISITLLVATVILLSTCPPARTLFSLSGENATANLALFLLSFFMGAAWWVSIAYSIRYLIVVRKPPARLGVLKNL
jgi:hypothetical protein